MSTLRFVIDILQFFWVLISNQDLSETDVYVQLWLKHKLYRLHQLLQNLYKVLNFTNLLLFLWASSKQ